MHDSVEFFQFFQINVKSWGSNLRLPDENTARFEDRIREAEKEIGIAPENGVVILYKRQPG
jgi:hypothetical protein